MTALTRGPLPARVYWRRRLLLLLLVATLLVGAVRLMGLGGDPEPEKPQATQAAAEPTEDASEPAVTASDTPSEVRDRRTRRQQAREPVLAEPEGVCSDRDVAVTPSVRTPVEGSPVTFTLELRSISTPACTWQVSPSTVTMKITSGSDDIWSSQQCPRAIPRKEVVLRQDVGTEVEVTWSGRRSDEECSRMAGWAMPGWYYVDAAALAGEPSDLHFELEKPEPEVEERTVEPDPKTERDKKQQRVEEQQSRDDRRGGRDNG